ncbi:MAG TPA: flagellar hook-basal body complex protein [Ignavibacteriales bacterium]|nr:flagellar hook-basal body complex protein [Ignavibacteriales bacterium]
MSFTGSLFSSVSGLKNHQSMMDVIGNNISNVNTIGYKQSRISFAETFANTLTAGKKGNSTIGGINPNQIGLGAKISAIDRIWSQGPFERTGVSTDVAIQGKGMFIVKSNGVTYFQRAGNFTFDQDGRLINPTNGAILQGKMANANGEIPSGNAISDIIIDQNQKLAAEPTKNINWVGNLSSSTPVQRTQKVTVNGNLSSSNAVGANVSTNVIEIYNEDGKAFNLNVSYTKTADNTWTLNYSVKDTSNNDLTPPIAGSISGLVFEMKDGKMVLNDASKAKFDGVANRITSSANLLDFVIDAKAITQDASADAAIATQDGSKEAKAVSSIVTVYDSLGNKHNINLKFVKVAENKWKYTIENTSNSGTIENGNGTLEFNSDGSIKSIVQDGKQVSSLQVKFNPSTGASTNQIINFNIGTVGSLSGISQTTASSNLNVLSQDGSEFAPLTNITINQYGVVEGVFANGKTKALAQILVANFKNIQGLEGIGDGLYRVSPNSGEAVITEFGADSGSNLQTQVLEQSNVDIAEEFSKMIIAQRGFQANARVITATDNLLQEATNIVR